MVKSIHHGQCLKFLLAKAAVDHFSLHGHSGEQLLSSNRSENQLGNGAFVFSVVDHRCGDVGGIQFREDLSSFFVVRGDKMTIPEELFKRSLFTVSFHPLLVFR